MTIADIAAARTTRINQPSNILVIDIERLPGLARVWEPRTRYIAPRNFVEWPSLLCFAARWYGTKTPIFESAWDDRDRMIRKAWELYDRADIVVTFNGIRFDNKHLRSDWLEAGLEPPAPWKDVDLFQQVKQFGWESKSLDSVSRRLGRPGKALHYDMDGAQAAMRGDKAAQRELKTYNIGDIELTEWLYDRLRGWMPTHPFAGAGDEARCNQCNSTELNRQKSTYRAVVIDYALYRCGGCGANVRGGWHSRAATTRGAR